MDLSGIDAMLSELKAASNAASGKAPEAAASNGVDFASVLKQSIDQVNTMQQAPEKLVKAMETGSGNNADLTEVMLSLQKANISFQEMVQVRNKLVTAYNDIMNMQV